MFERFTERARQVVVLAQEEARKIPNDHIGVEHVFLGCMVEEEGIAARVLATLDLDADYLRKMIPHNDKILSPGAQVPFTPRGKKSLEFALREALTQGHNYIGTEHVLLGTLKDPGSILDKYLTGELGHDYAEIIRCETLELLRGPRPIAGEVDLNEEERRELKLKDVLIDVMTGFKMWKETKQLNAEDWTDADEAFSRWVDGAGVGDFL